MIPRFIEGKKVIDTAIREYTTVTIPMGGPGALTDIIPNTKVPVMGLPCWLVFVGNAIASGGEDQVKFTLFINDVPVEHFTETMDQWAEPTEINNELLVKFIPLSGGDRVRVAAQNFDAVTDYAATARILALFTER